MRHVFFSHTWRPDKLGRDNHERVKKLVKAMQKIGWITWFDEEDMLGNIDSSMADGIDSSQCVVFCLTEEYCLKINEAARNSRKRDNCFKEWNYSHTRNKLIIPIIMEPYLLDTSKWPAGVIPLYLGSTLYLDASSDDKMVGCVYALHKTLLDNGIYPSKTSIYKNPFVLKNSLKRFNSISKFYTRNFYRRPRNITTEIRI